MVLGCPVMVSNKYAMPEQVGKAGLLFNPDSSKEMAYCIERVWKDENLRQKMKVLGYKRVKNWSEDKFKNRLKKIINSM